MFLLIFKPEIMNKTRRCQHEIAFFMKQKISGPHQLKPIGPVSTIFFGYIYST